MKPLILASASPVRKDILQEAGAPFTVEVSDYEEDMSLAMEPDQLAIYLSQGKARAVAARHHDAIILGADSFAVFDGQLLGKPHTNARAREMLTMLSGQHHRYLTGFTVIDSVSGREHSEAVESTVYFRCLSSRQIDDYLAAEDVLAKAAAYDSTGLGRQLLIEKIIGDPNNVRGLPIDRVLEVARDFGAKLTQ
jgi:septum formation protein